MTEPGRHATQTPDAAELKLAEFSDALREAADLLALAIDAETEAESIRDDAFNGAFMSDECPKVGVFGGVRITVAYQKAWVMARIAVQERNYKRAAAARRKAVAELKTIERQGSHQQSIAKSVGDAYRGTTGRGSW